jgi:flagellar motor switch protein FliN/FliY
MNEPLELEQLQGQNATFAPANGPVADLRRLSDVPVDVAVEMGRARMTVGETLTLRQGSIIPLNRMAGEPVDLLVNGAAIARGEVVVIDEQFGLRITDVLGQSAEESSPTAPDAPADGPTAAQELDAA